LTRFIDGGIYAGKLDPTHNIRLMGVPCCSFCPGISDYHSGECATNKEKQEAFLARKKKLAEKNKATPTKPTKSIRRGKHGGLREIDDLAQDPQGELELGARGEVRRHYKTLVRRHCKSSK